MAATAVADSVSVSEEHLTYQTPLVSRYASKEMCYNFSDQKKFSTWRKLWLYLATVEKVMAREGAAMLLDGTCTRDPNMNLIIQYGLLGLVLRLGLGFILYCRIWHPWHYCTCAHSHNALVCKPDIRKPRCMHLWLPLIAWRCQCTYVRRDTVALHALRCCYIYIPRLCMH